MSVAVLTVSGNDRFEVTVPAGDASQALLVTKNRRITKTGDHLFVFLFES